MEFIWRYGNLWCKLLDWILWPFFIFYSLIPRSKLPKLNDPDILKQSATSLAKKIREKELTSEEVVKVYVARCRNVNPYINAIVDDRFPEAIIEARTVDQALSTTEKTVQQLEVDTPFLGVPFTAKESCSMAGLSFSLGSRSRANIKAETDGVAVKNLRDAGGIPLAVTNIPEFCSSYETNNFITGYTRNPYNLRRTAGGSSGGEAALMGAAGSVIGIASDFGGSTRIPCLFNGVFGHKPTPGIISAVGHFPYVSTSDFLKYFSMTIMTRYSVDLKPLLKVLAAENAQRLALDTPVYVKKLRIFYVQQATSTLPVSNSIKAAIENGALYLKKQHGCPVEKVTFPEFNEYIEICVAVCSAIDGIKSNLQYVSKNTNILIDIIRSFLKLSDYTLGYTLLRFFISTKGFISEKNRKTYFELRDKLNTKILNLLGEDGVLLYPTFSGPAFYRRQQICKLPGAFYSIIFNVLGYPATQVPVGIKNKLPIGFQIVAAPNQDRLCLAIAEQMEIAFDGWTPPPSK